MLALTIAFWQVMYTGADVEHTVDRLDSKLNGMQDRLSYIELAQSNMLPLTSLHRSADQRENEELMINISQVEDQKWTQSLYSYDDHHSMLSSEPERRPRQPRFKSEYSHQKVEASVQASEHLPPCSHSSYFYLDVRHCRVELGPFLFFFPGIGVWLAGWPC
ncbi:unnamed protein product [Somion occarium]|uniref:Uncharacterized protein n=1 Tax=Somion occarium TaxID=3059160 RepID=A0ABP1CHF6_9APHY